MKVNAFSDVFFFLTFSILYVWFFLSFFFALFQRMSVLLNAKGSGLGILISY